MAGLYFEQFDEGQVFDHAMSRTVSEMDNVLFCSLTMNPQPLHLDEEFAKQTEFGQRLVNSLFTLGLVFGISVGETTLGTTVANLGFSEVRFPKPVFHGDTLRVPMSAHGGTPQPENGLPALDCEKQGERFAQ